MNSKTMRDLLNECADRETIKSIYDAMRTAAPSIKEKPESGGG